MGLIFINETFLKFLSAVCITKIFSLYRLIDFRFAKVLPEQCVKDSTKHDIYLMKQKYENQLNALDLTLIL